MKFTDRTPRTTRRRAGRRGGERERGVAALGALARRRLRIVRSKPRGRHGRTGRRKLRTGWRTSQGGMSSAGRQTARLPVAPRRKQVPGPRRSEGGSEGPRSPPERVSGMPVSLYRQPPGTAAVIALGSGPRSAGARSQFGDHVSAPAERCPHAARAARFPAQARSRGPRCRGWTSAASCRTNHAAGSCMEPSKRLGTAGTKARMPRPRSSRIRPDRRG